MTSQMMSSRFVTAFEYDFLLNTVNWITCYYMQTRHISIAKTW